MGAQTMPSATELWEELQERHQKARDRNKGNRTPITVLASARTARSSSCREQVMKKETNIQGVPVRIDSDTLKIGSEPGDWWLDRDNAPELIAFIQQWLDHNPEGELRQEVVRLATVYPHIADNIIAAVREHDRKYGKP